MENIGNPVASLKQLLPLANALQKRYAEAVIASDGNVSQAAATLGKARATVRDQINALKAKGVRQGLAPEHNMTHGVPEGMHVKGVSTYYDSEGNVTGQWVKAYADAEQELKIIEAAAEAASSSLKRERAVPAPKHVQDDLCNVFVITDFHLGMLAWGEETRGDDCTALAEDLLYAWFADAIKRAPKASQAVFCQLGDFLHYDGLEAITPASGHILDADTRYQKIVRVAIRAIRRITRELLRTHDKVHLVMADGNHDQAGSAWLRELFHALYDEEPRVTVDRSPDPYYSFEFGDTSLFFHHKRRPEQVDDVFVSKFRDMFGRTKHSYAHLGHMHHAKLLEKNLMVVEQHRTLAGKDAYASRGGWMAGRSASCITYHRQHGEVGRIVLSPEML